MQGRGKPTMTLALLLLGLTLSIAACSQAQRQRLHAVTGCTAASVATPDCKQSSSGTCTCPRDVVATAH